MQRARLIRVLQEVGGLGPEAIRSVVEALDAPDARTSDVLEAALDAQAARPSQGKALDETPEWQETAREVDAFLEQVGWPTRPEASARKALVDAVSALREFEPDLPVTALFPYVRAAGELAQHEVAQAMGALAAGPEEAVEAMVRGTVLWERAFTPLRRLALESLTRRVLRSAQPKQPGPEGQGHDAQPEAHDHRIDHQPGV